MMKYAKRIVFVMLLLFVTGLTPALSQEGNNAEGGGKEKTETGKAARRKAKKEWKEQRRNDMSDAKARKDYTKKNTKKTRKRMKKNEKKAKRNNEHKRRFFLTRWFEKRRN